MRALSPTPQSVTRHNLYLTSAICTRVARRSPPELIAIERCALLGAAIERRAMLQAMGVGKPQQEQSSDPARALVQTPAPAKAAKRSKPAKRTTPKITFVTVQPVAPASAADERPADRRARLRLEKAAAEPDVVFSYVRNGVAPQDELDLAVRQDDLPITQRHVPVGDPVGVIFSEWVVELDDVRLPAAGQCRAVGCEHRAEIGRQYCAPCRAIFYRPDIGVSVADRMVRSARRSAPANVPPARARNLQKLREIGARRFLQAAE